MDRLRASAKSLALIAVGVLLAAGTYAIASIPDSNGVITGCWDHTAGATYGALRVIDPSLSGNTRSANEYSGGSSETQITWNQQGPTGPAGPAGPQGVQGLQGPRAPSSFLSYSSGGGKTMLLKLPGVKGESKVPKYKGWIDLRSVSFGGSNNPQKSEIIVVKHLDSTSPELALRTANGKPFDEATLVFRKGGSKPVEYLKFTMKNVLVTSLTNINNPQDKIPEEQVTLNFTKVTEEFLGNRHTTIHLTPSQIRLP
jgi:type VI secretion system secreted protein Hcp